MIKGIHHISLTCSSEEQYEKTVNFYRDILGLKVARKWADGIMLQAGESLLEIFNNGDCDLSKGTIRHFAFSVTDTDEQVRKVKEAGYEVFEGPKDIKIPSEPEYPARIAFCYGPLGEEIEFFEEKPLGKEEISTGIKEAAATAAGVSLSQKIADKKNFSTAEDVISVSNLCKQYPAFRLDNVSFSVKQGRIMGFIGRNGAGKTTTLKCLLDLVKPDSGSISFFGLDIKEHERKIKQKIGYASGGVDFFNKKKISEIIKVTKRFYDEWDDAVYKDYMQKFSIDENKKPEELSDGMRVKLNLVIALSHNAKLFLLDEPTSGLDPVSRDEIITIFGQLKEQGCAILFSTHVTSDLDKCADDITYIHNGKIIASQTKEEFIENNKEHGNNVEDIMIYMEKQTR